MKNPLLVPELREMIAAGDFKALLGFCEATHPAMAADLIFALSPSEARMELRHAEPRLRAEIFSHLDEDLQARMVQALGRDDTARSIADMPPDERADLFKRIPPKTQCRVAWRAAL